MGSSHASSEDEADAMAAAMGFSSFGTQGPSKKRKFNPKTDAFIEGQELAHVDKGGKKGQGSGGNQIPLGKPRVFGKPSGESARIMENEEIPLDDVGGPQYTDDEDEGPRYLDTSRPPPIMDRTGQNEDDILLDRNGHDRQQDHVNSSIPQASEAAREAQDNIDAILAAATSLQDPLSRKQKPKAKDTQDSGLGAFMNALKTPVVPPGAPGAPPTLQPLPGTSLSQRPLPSPLSTAKSPGGSVASSQGPSNRRRMNEMWYVGYYDPSFNENPWKWLEQGNGLPNIGTWIERPKKEQGQTA